MFSFSQSKSLCLFLTQFPGIPQHHLYLAALLWGLSRMVAHGALNTWSTQLLILAAVDSIVSSESHYNEVNVFILA